MTASPHKQARRFSSTKAPARRPAYSILLRVETEGAYASELLHNRLDASIDERDAAPATELVMGTPRRQRLLDFPIERYTRRQTSALECEVLVVLRLGIDQLRHLTRIPPRAAGNESVELVKQARRKSAAALVNAVLRKAAAERELPNAKLLPPDKSTPDDLALRHSHPTWLVERWLRNLARKGRLRCSKAIIGARTMPVSFSMLHIGMTRSNRRGRRASDSRRGACLAMR